MRVQLRLFSLPKFLIPTLAVFLCGAVPNSAKSLQESFEAGLRKSESYAQQQQLFEQAEERYKQAIGAVLPSLALTGSYLRQDTPQNALGGSFSPPEQTTARLTASQPLFRGFREFAAMSEFSRLADAQKFTKKHAAVLLYQDIVRVFYQVLSFEADLKNLDRQVHVNEKRVKELEDRKKIGRSRNTEVLTVKAQLAQLEAQVQATKGQLSAAREMFEFLTGMDRDTSLADEDVVPKKIPTVSKYLERLDKRFDVQSEREKAEAADKAITVAKGEHLPTVDLLGNYYFKRPGALSSVHWDVQVTGTLPLFSGGTVVSKVRQSVSEKKRVDLEAQQVRRQSEQEIRSTYASLLSDQAQLDALEDAVTLSEKNYQEQSREYRFGLVTNLDVIQALNTAQQAQRDLDRVRYAMKSDFLRLEASAALRPMKGVP